MYTLGWTEDDGLELFTLGWYVSEDEIAGTFIDTFGNTFLDTFGNTFGDTFNT